MGDSCSTCVGAASLVGLRRWRIRRGDVIKAKVAPLWLLPVPNELIVYLAERKTKCTASQIQAAVIEISFPIARSIPGKAGFNLLRTGVQ